MKFIGFSGPSFSGWQTAMEQVQSYLAEHKKHAIIDNLTNYTGGIYNIDPDEDMYILCRVKTEREAAFLTESSDDLLIIIANKLYFPAHDIVKLEVKEDHDADTILQDFGSCPNSMVVSGRGRELNQAAIHAVRNKYIVG